ncbi:MAG: thiol-disulfide oxidoreductase DCC family protein [Deltaproteobacteria bacterium]
MLTRPVLLYDGTCGFCRAWIDRLRRWDRVGRIDYVAYQQRAAVAGLPPISDDALDRAAHLVAPDGRVQAGARAIPLLLNYLPGGRLLKPFFHVPGVPWVADRVYAWVAANRHRLGGPGSTCGV